MPRQRKIKHYSYGYLNRRKRRGKVLKLFLFLIILAGLIFLGYCAAKSIGDLSNRHNSTESSESSLLSDLLPESSEDTDSSELEATESSIPETESISIQAAVLPADIAANAEKTTAYLESLDSNIYNTVVVDLKDETGILSYQSAVPLAATCGAISPDAMTLEELKNLAKTIIDAGYTPAARIYTLKDDTASHASYQTSYIYEDQMDVTWLDQAAAKGGRSWLNPYMPAAKEYLVDITTEIAQAGFTRIFAAGIQYPETRFPQQMGYGPNQDSMDLTQALQSVLDSLISAGTANGAEIIPVYIGECYLGENENFYNGSPNTLKSDYSAPILTEGKETEILDAIQTPVENLIPVIQYDQLEKLEAKGLKQYLIEP